MTDWREECQSLSDENERLRARVRTSDAKDPETCDHGPDEERRITETISWCRSCGTVIERGEGFEDFSAPAEDWRAYGKADDWFRPATEKSS